MKKRSIGIGIILAVIGVGVAVLLVGGNAKEAKQTMLTETKPVSSENKSADVTSVAAGIYTDYSENAFKNAAGTRLLFFHAPWCPQCRALDADIKAKGAPENVTILKVDYDSNQALRKKYGVTLQTTIVKVDGAGNLAQKYVAYDEPTLSAVIENVL